MMIQRIEKSCSIVTPTKVWVGEVDGVSRDDIVDYALIAGGETRGSIFGYRVSQPTDDGAVVVTIHKD